MKKITLVLTLLFFSFIGGVNYLSAQNFQWAHSLVGTGTSAGGGGEIIRVWGSTAETNGNVYYCGSIYGTVDFDPGTGVLNKTSTTTDKGFIAKYDAGGNLIWVQIIPTSMEVSAVTLVNTNLLYASVNGLPANTAFVISLDKTTGNILYTGPSWSASQLKIADISNSQNGTSTTNNMVILTGHFAGTLNISTSGGPVTLTSNSGSVDIFYVIIPGNFTSGTFNPVAAKSIGGSVGDVGFSCKSHMTTPGIHNYFIGGFFQGTNVDFNTGTGTNLFSSAGSQDGFILQLDNNYDYLNCESFGGTAEDYCYSLDIAGSSSPNVLAGGMFSGTVLFGSISKTSNGPQDAFVMRCDATINPLWVQQTGFTNQDVVLDVAYSSTSDKLYATGYWGSSSGSTPFISGFNATTGANLSIGGLLNPTPTNSYNEGKTICVGSSNEFVYTGGHFAGTSMDADPSSGTLTLTNPAAPFNFGGYIHKLSTCTSATTPVIAATSTSICTGGNTILTVSNPSLNGNNEWKWYSGSCGGTLVGIGDSISVSPSSTTTYFVRGEGGCAATSTCSAGQVITINTAPSMTSASTATVCSGVALNINLTSSAPSSYTWSAANNPLTIGESLTAQSTPTLNDIITSVSTTAQTVTYTITPTSTSGSCVGNPQTVTVTVNPAPGMTSATSTSVCSGTPINFSLTSNIPSNYTWIAADNPNTTGESTTTQNLAIITDTPVILSPANETITYTITPASVSGGCQGTSQTLTVTVNDMPDVFGNNVTICEGQTADLEASTSIGNISWYSNTSGGSPLATGPIYTTPVLTADTVYYVEADNNGCINSPRYAIFVTVNPMPDVTVTVAGYTLTANTSGAMYQWLDCNNSFAPIAGETNQSYTATTAGSYAVAINLNGCVDTSGCSLLVGINELSMQNAISLYPNPTSGNFIMELNSPEQELKVEITNSLGQIIFIQEYTNTNKIELNITDEAGIYFLKVTANGKGSSVSKIIKQ